MGTGQTGEEGFNTLRSEEVRSYSLPRSLAAASRGAWDSWHRGRGRDAGGCQTL